MLFKGRNGILKLCESPGLTLQRTPHPTTYPDTPYVPRGTPYSYPCPLLPMAVSTGDVSLSAVALISPYPMPLPYIDPLPPSVFIYQR